jgi:hypothetical protein
MCLTGLESRVSNLHVPCSTCLSFQKQQNSSSSSSSRQKGPIEQVTTSRASADLVVSFFEAPPRPFQPLLFNIWQLVAYSTSAS